MKYLLLFVTVLLPIGVVNSASIPGVKIYGNWCGPKHGSGTPIDALDRICMVHDNCYDSHGYFNCKCDYNMARSIGKLKSAKLKIIGAPMKTWFRSSPCQGPVRRFTFCGWRPCTRCKKTWIVTSIKRYMRYKC